MPTGSHFVNRGSRPDARSAADVSTEFGREVRGEQPAAMETRREPGITAEEVRREETVRSETHVEEAPAARRTVPSLTRLSAADLQVYLKGMDYPAGKPEIVVQARKNNAPQDDHGDRGFRHTGRPQT